jgi:RNase P subunit RPR2
MKTKERKVLQIELANSNIDFFLNLIKTRFNPEFDKFYIREIERLTQGFNIRLKREEKLLFCKKCRTFLDASTREIRFDSENKTKDVICKNCGNVRKYRYK